MVEDDQTNRRVVEALLCKLGLTVTLADDGQKGFDAIMRGDAADLILMDLHMPVLDGYAATGRIRQWEREHGHLPRPIIALTADAFEEDRQHCLAAGMDDFLTKPIVFGTLHALIAKWLPAKLRDAPVQTKAATNVEPVDTAKVLAILQQLEPLLAQNQFDAIARFKELQQAVADTRVSAEINALGPLLEKFHFDAVLDRLRQIAATQAWNGNKS